MTLYRSLRSTGVSEGRHRPAIVEQAERVQAMRYARDLAKSATDRFCRASEVEGHSPAPRPFSNPFFCCKNVSRRHIFEPCGMLKASLSIFTAMLVARVSQNEG